MAEGLLTAEELKSLIALDTPTICNAIEAFKVRDQTYGYTGVDVRCLFPDLGVMVGYAVTVTIAADQPAPVAVRPSESSHSTIATSTSVARWTSSLRTM